MAIGKNIKASLKIFLVLILFFKMTCLSGQNFQTRLSDFVASAPLDIRVGTYGDIQIWRDGETEGQLFYESLENANGACVVPDPACWSMYNGVFMVVGNNTIVSYNSALDGFDDLISGSVSDLSGLGTVASPWTISVNYNSIITPGYGFNMVYYYVNGNDFIDVSMTPVLPASNTEVVKVFHLIDTYLSGFDTGPAYVEGSAPYNLVGVSNPDGDLYEAFVVTESPWDRYVSANYDDVLNEPYNDGQLSNTLNTNPLNDNAIGVQWTLGAVSGTQPTIKYRIGFANSPDAFTDGCPPVWLNRHIARPIKGS